MEWLHVGAMTWGDGLKPSVRRALGKHPSASWPPEAGTPPRTKTAAAHAGTLLEDSDLTIRTPVHSSRSGRFFRFPILETGVIQAAMKGTICVGISREFSGSELGALHKRIESHPAWTSRSPRPDDTWENFFMPWMAGLSFWEIKTVLGVRKPGGFLYDLGALGKKRFEGDLKAIEEIVDNAEGLCFKCVLVDETEAKGSRQRPLVPDMLKIQYTSRRKWEVGWAGDFVGGSDLKRGVSFLQRMFGVLGDEYAGAEFRVVQKETRDGTMTKLVRVFVMSGRAAEACEFRKSSDTSDSRNGQRVSIGAFWDDQIAEFSFLEEGEIPGEKIVVSGLLLERAKEVFSEMEQIAFEVSASGVGQVSLIARELEGLKAHVESINKVFTGPWQLCMPSVRTRATWKSLEEVFHRKWDGLELLPLGFFKPEDGKRIMVNAVKKAEDGYVLVLQSRKTTSQKNAEVIRREFAAACGVADMFEGFAPEKWVYRLWGD